MHKDYQGIWCSEYSKNPCLEMSKLIPLRDNQSTYFDANFVPYYKTEFEIQLKNKQFAIIITLPSRISKTDPSIALQPLKEQLIRKKQLNS